MKKKKKQKLTNDNDSSRLFNNSNLKNRIQRLIIKAKKLKIIDNEGVVLTAGKKWR